MRLATLALAGLLPLTALAAPLYTVDAPSAEQISAAASQAGLPQRLSLAVPMQLDTRNDGSWQQTDAGWRWAARIHAPGADSLSLVLEDVQLAPGASISLHGVDADASQGPYSARHVEDGILRTALLFGDTVELRLNAPAGSRPALKVSQVNYGFAEAFGLRSKSGNCNIDVACSEGSPHQEQIRSTVLLEIPDRFGSVACSGLLVNNSRGDFAPYILTADHCGITTSNDAQVQVYWRFQRDNCVQPGPHGHERPDPSLSQTGTELLADGAKSDFTLLVIGDANNPDLPASNFTPFWSGWDRGDTAARSGLGVHHPQGNEKAISFFETVAQSVRTEIDNRPTDAWQVVWDNGTTEQGSSGSGLWNQDGRVVGVLSGGEASCSNQDGPDFYGRLNVAWAEEARCDSQLAFWLDPDDQGGTVLNGAENPGPAANPQIPNCDPNSSPVVTPTPTPSETASPTPTATPGNSSGGSSSGSLGMGSLLFLGLLLSRNRRGFSLT